MNGTRTCRYPDLQVALHWIIAFLVIVQAFVANGATGRMAEAKEKGLALSLASRIGAKLHVAFGVTVFLLAPVRVGVRLHRGAPLRPDDDPMTTQLAPHLIHVLLYAVILLIPVSGIIACHSQAGLINEPHALGMNAVLLIIGVHVAGALHRRFVARTEVLVRMLQP